MLAATPKRHPVENCSAHFSQPAGTISHVSELAEERSADFQSAVSQASSLLQCQDSQWMTERQEDGQTASPSPKTPKFSEENLGRTPNLT